MPVKAKKIALVYDAIYPYVKGGAERRYYELATRLVRDGYDVHLYGMQFWEGESVRSERGMTLHGLCPAMPLYTASGRRSVKQAVYFGLACTKLLWVDFDVLDCSGFPYFSIFPARLATWLRRKPLYVTWHEVWGRQYWQKYLGALGLFGYAVEWLASRLPTTIVAVSTQTAERLSGVLGTKRPLVVVENGIDLSAMSGIKPNTAAGCDIVSVGRLVEHKNQKLLIQALPLVQKRRAGATLLLVSDGPDRAALEQLAGSLGVSGSVRFTGFVEDNRDVYALIAASKVFALTSLREGFGIVVLEANALGLPALVVDAPDNAATQIVGPGNGLVVQPTAEAVTGGLLRLLRDRKQLSASSRAVAGNYDWEQQLARTLEVWHV